MSSRGQQVAMSSGLYWCKLCAATRNIPRQVSGIARALQAHDASHTIDESDDDESDDDESASVGSRRHRRRHHRAEVSDDNCCQDTLMPIPDGSLPLPRGELRAAPWSQIDEDRRRQLVGALFSRHSQHPWIDTSATAHERALRFGQWWCMRCQHLFVIPRNVNNVAHITNQHLYKHAQAARKIRDGSPAQSTTDNEESESDSNSAKASDVDNVELFLSMEDEFPWSLTQGVVQSVADDILFHSGSIELMMDWRWQRLDSTVADTA